jgi:hypothetical protein
VHSRGYLGRSRRRGVDPHCVFGRNGIAFHQEYDGTDLPLFCVSGNEKVRWDYSDGLGHVKVGRNMGLMTRGALR